MISYHPNRAELHDASRYWRGFQAVPTVYMDRIAKCVSMFNWSPIVWKDGHRSQDNFESCHLLVFDFDDPEMTLADAVNRFSDCRHVIGTTRNHQKEKNGVVCDRFRVILEFDHPINDLRMYRYTMQRHMDFYPVDEKCKDGARFFHPCNEIISVSTDGFTCDSYRNVPENFENFDPKKHVNKLKLFKKAGMFPQHIREALFGVLPDGHRNGLFFKAMKDLLKMGMPADEILTRVLNSPTYKDVMTPKLLTEVKRTWRSAVESAAKELEVLCGEEI